MFFQKYCMYTLNHNTHLRHYSSALIKVKIQVHSSFLERMLISAFSTVYAMKTRWLIVSNFLFCLVLALWRVWHNYKLFVWASSQAPVPLDWMLLSMENRGLLVSVQLAQCAETKGHDRCQDRGPDLDLCLSSRPSAVIHAGLDMSLCHLCEYMKFMNETLECCNTSRCIQIQGWIFEDCNLVLNK